MTSRIFFVLNDLNEFNFSEHIKTYLTKNEVIIGTQLPPHIQDYRLIVLWNYRKIIKDIPNPNNVILFHSSDLPYGKGWAPIYYAITEKQKYYIISGIFASGKIDSGDVIIKARFQILPNYRASDIRRFDSEISIILVKKILERFKSQAIAGRPQISAGSYRFKRTIEDNRIDTSLTFETLVPHLRACETSHPAYFEFEGIRYDVMINTSTIAEFPDIVEITFDETWRDKILLFHDREKGTKVWL